MLINSYTFAVGQLNKFFFVVLRKNKNNWGISLTQVTTIYSVQNNVANTTDCGNMSKRDTYIKIFH